MNKKLLDSLQAAFSKQFGVAPSVVAYAPGRVEVLGNHTDYNEGFVMSAAINRGTFFAMAPATDGKCRLLATDRNEECTFSHHKPAPATRTPWANYVKGVVAKLPIPKDAPAFFAAIAGDIPLGAGLSSSASLEISAGLAVARFYGLAVSDLELARIAQAAEHDFAGAKCGLLDQVSSLFGKADQLIISDFRTLAIDHVPLGQDMSLLICDTGVKHELVESEYNSRRAQCEAAAAYFSRVCDHPVTALRDVSPEELQAHAAGLDPETWNRAAHVVGENDRVQRARHALAQGDLEQFGELMFASHQSSRSRFQNSCAELDVLVDAARTVPEILGARLSGGGFGGSVVALLRHSNAIKVAKALQEAYVDVVGAKCSIMEVRPSDGARVLEA